MQHPPRRQAVRLMCLAALACYGGAALAQADTLAKIQDSRKIRIAIDLNVPPWSYKNDKLETTGSEVETAQLLAKDLGAELEIVTTNGANRIPLLITNRADLVVSAMTITPERQKSIDFSIPYSGISTFVAAPKAMQIKTPADLAGKRIAVTRGTTNDSDITKLAPPGAEVVRFEDEATTMTAIVSGQVDIVAQASTLIVLINQRAPSRQLEPKLPLQESLFGMGMRKGDVRLKEWVDAWVLKRLKSGELQAIYRKHQGAELPAAVLRQTP